MDTNNKHDLFYELEAFDPRWQMHYNTIAKAAQAAKVLPMYAKWLKTEPGMRYLELVRDLPDTVAQNEAERKLREAAIRMMQQ